ncbi:hypothetical protein [Pendulispora albinea]|uniref:Lipoprotein n=1 Tax=Pendulispora albinea TaxID=2741071 RepID=A0ABZ2LTJ3_9BACT
MLFVGHLRPSFHGFFEVLSTFRNARMRIVFPRIARAAALAFRPNVPIALITLITIGVTFGCSKPKPDVQYREPVSVRLSVGSGRPQLEMALALTPGHGEPPPTAIADALFRIASECPEIDSLAKSEGFVRLRLKVHAGALHLAPPSPSDPAVDPLATCAGKAIENAAFSAKGNPSGDSDFDAMAEIRAAVASNETTKGNKE